MRNDKSKDRGAWEFIFLISNHLMDLANINEDNKYFNNYKNGFWDVEDMSKLYHFSWYTSYLMFFLMSFIALYYIVKNK